jgi:hypothetical protein
MKTNLKTFSVGMLFSILRGDITKQNELVQADEGVSFIAQNDTDNGFVKRVNAAGYRQFPAGSIIIGRQTGAVYFESTPFITTDGVLVLIPNNFKLTKYTGLYLVALLKKQLGVFGYTNTVSATKLSDFMLPLPVTADGTIDFGSMERYICIIEEERIRELEAYLIVTGLADYTLTADERQFLQDYQAGVAKYKAFRIVDIFDVKNTQSIMSRDITLNSGTTPYLTASGTNNAVGGYITFDDSFLDKGNCIFIGGKTFVVSYQGKDFFSNDSHNLALYLKETGAQTKENQLFMVASIYKSLSSKYSWGDSISYKKIQADEVNLPIDTNGNPDYAFMTAFIHIQQKRAISRVCDWKDKEIAAAKNIVGV